MQILLLLMAFLFLSLMLFLISRDVVSSTRENKKNQRIKELEKENEELRDEILVLKEELEKRV